MKCYAKSSVNLIARLANLQPKITFFIKVFSFVFFVPEKRSIFAKVQRRIKSKIRLSYRLNFKPLVVNQSNMLHRIQHLSDCRRLSSSDMPELPPWLFQDPQRRRHRTRFSHRFVGGGPYLSKISINVTFWPSSTLL